MYSLASSPIPESGGAFRVAVYSPYVILNKTGMDIMVKSKSLLQSARAAAGQVQSGESPQYFIVLHF